MVNKKTASHRQELGKKYLIQKKVKAHRRKLKKLAKKGNLPGVKKLRKDPGIPNLFPFKEQLLRTILKNRDDAKSAAEAHKAERKRKRQAELTQNMATAKNLSLWTRPEDNPAFRADAAAAAAASGVAADRTLDNLPERRKFWSELNRVITQADVVLEILDARDPLGSRSQAVEERVRGKGKRLVLVLNKIDLVPPAVVAEWMTLLRRQAPVIAFRASVQTQRRNIGQARAGHGPARAAQGRAADSSVAFGVDNLLQLLKNYCRTPAGGMKTLTIGVIGYPNVGKSSLINSLCRRAAAPVASTPGCTTSVSEIEFDKNLRILDSPGVLMAQDTAASTLALRNVLRVDRLQPEVVRDAAEQIVSRCAALQLVGIYSLEDQIDTRNITPNTAFPDPSMFLTILARKRGMFGKGSRPLLHTAARLVVEDWNSGKISFYVRPPAADSVAPAAEDEVVRVKGALAPAFDIDAMISSQIAEISTVRMVDGKEVDVYTQQQKGGTRRGGAAAAPSVVVAMQPAAEDLKAWGIESTAEVSMDLD